MKHLLIQWAAWAALLGAALFPFGAASADSYPSRPVKIIVPFGPGTGSDVLARTLAAKLSDALGEAFTVENREGAGGLIGAKAVLNAAPDGYTLMLAANPFVVSPLLYENAPYDPVKDFAPIAKIAVVPNVLIVHPTVAPQTMNTLIAQAKAAPGSLFYASSGKGTPSELEMELLKSMYEIDLVEVPYKNTGQAMTDLIAGQVQLYYPTLPVALPHIRSGRVRALAMGGLKRSPLAPDIPTMAEALGDLEYEAQTWYGLVVAAATPRDIVVRLNEEVAKAMQTPEMKDRLAKLGAEPASGDTQAFAKQMRSEVQKWSKLIKRIGLRIE